VGDARERAMDGMTAMKAITGIIAITAMDGLSR